MTPVAAWWTQWSGNSVIVKQRIAEHAGEKRDKAGRIKSPWAGSFGSVLLLQVALQCAASRILSA